MGLTRITSDGIKDGTITGSDLATNVDLVDNQKLRLGTGNDLEIYHDGSSSYIDHNGAGNLLIRGNNTNAIVLRAVQSENSLICHANAQVQLYHNNSLKLETTTGGATITGVCTATSFAGDGSSLSGINTDLVSDTSPQLGGDLDTNSHNIKLDDNHYVYFGDGDDFSIRHDGTYNRFKGANFIFNNAAGNESIIEAYQDGAVQLYHNNSKKFETTSAGITVTGSVTSGSSGFITTGNFATNADAAEFRCGANADFKISHNGTENILRGDFPTVFRNNANNETLAKLTPNGAVELYYDNSKKFETKSYGALVTGYITASPTSGNLGFHAGDNTKMTFGAGDDLQIYHDGVNGSYIDNVTGTADLYIRNTNGNSIYLNPRGSEVGVKIIPDGAVELYHNNSKKFETTANGINVTGRIECDRADIDGQINLQYPNSTNSNYMAALQNNNGIMHLFRGDGLYIGSNMNTSNQSGGPNNKNITLHTSGEIESGTILPTSNNAKNLGSASLRWANVYTNDLNLSNEGGANDVDGTWGSYTIQEGAEDLFLVNKRNGKKYKFNLTEVS